MTNTTIKSTKTMHPGTIIPLYINDKPGNRFVSYCTPDVTISRLRKETSRCWDAYDACIKELVELERRLGEFGSVEYHKLVSIFLYYATSKVYSPHKKQQIGIYYIHPGELVLQYPYRNGTRTLHVKATDLSQEDE